MYPAPLLLLEAGSNLRGSGPSCSEGSPLLSEAGSNIYRRIFCYAKQAVRLCGSPCSSGWMEFMPAHPPRRRPSVKPCPAQPLISEAGSNPYGRSFCYAEQAAKMHSSRCSPGWKQSVPAQPPLQRPSVKPGPAQPSTSECGGNLYWRSFCYAKLAARMCSSLCSSGREGFVPDQASGGGCRPSMVRRKAAAGMTAAWPAAAGNDLSCLYSIDASSSLGSSGPPLPRCEPFGFRSWQQVYAGAVFVFGDV